MTQLFGTAWRRLVGDGPWRRGQPFGVLDIGTSKLCCYIAKPRAGQGVQLIGRGYQLAEGLKGGEIVDAEAAEASVLAALHEAEQQSGETLREIFLAVGGGHPQSSYVRVESALHGRSVADLDLQLLLDRARREASSPGARCSMPSRSRLPWTAGGRCATRAAPRASASRWWRIW
ncbi:MAG: cell division protein FtsA [Geminicoccaceae bacterium]